MADEQTTDASADTAAQADATQQPEPTVEELKAQVAQAAEQKLKLERALTRQSTELGQYRKMADQALLRETTGQQAAGKEKPDFFADPDRAVAAAIEGNPLVKKIVENAAAIHQDRFVQAMNGVLPDFRKVTTSDEFVKWVAEDPIRSEMYVRADQNLDVAAGKNLLGTWKERQSLQKTLKETNEQNTQTDLKAAKATTGTSGTTTKKVYSRIDLMRLRTSDPEKYNSLNVPQLYAEGRVK